MFCVAKALIATSTKRARKLAHSVIEISFSTAHRHLDNLNYLFVLVEVENDDIWAPSSPNGKNVRALERAAVIGLVIL